MSADVESESSDTMMCCASCGIAEVDEIKLKKCNACKLVRYCSVKCQRDHRPKHKRECKKRAAELRDEILFKQPESSNWGDCPICCLPLPIDQKKCVTKSCCCKVVCHGCDYANQVREIQGSLERRCPFCRHAVTKNDEKIKMNLMKRVEANDPVALRIVGIQRCKDGDYKSAFEYWTKAAKLGDVESHYELSVMYRNGEGVEKDKTKEVYHLEEAAIGGHTGARNNLGCEELENFRSERAVKHWIIAANLGHDGSLKTLKEVFKTGLISNEDFAAALRGHQATVDATKSPQREEAEVAKQLQG